MKCAAISYVEREDGALLAVWNRRYGGWGLPGGKVEDGELIEDAQARELREETGLATVARSPLFVATSCTDTERVVHVYRIEASGEPREVEPGSPVAWLTRSELLEKSPFAAFYAELFAHVPSVQL